MSEYSEPSETMASPESNGLSHISSPEEYPLVLTGNDLSRMSSRAGISVPDSLFPGSPHEDDENAFEDENEYVSLAPQENNDLSYWFRQAPTRQPSQLDELHPFTEGLTISNVDDCVRVEEEAFPEQERCSREKVRIYCYHRSLFDCPLGNMIADRE